MWHEWKTWLVDFLRCHAYHAGSCFVGMLFHHFVTGKFLQRRLRARSEQAGMQETMNKQKEN